MKKLIEELNLTIKEFAELYKIPYNTVRQWYNGQRQAPPYIKKMIETIIELKSKGKQLSFEDELDERFLRYEKILKEYGTITPKIILWNKEKFIELRKRENTIILETGTATSGTTYKLEDEKELIKVINRIFK